VICLSWLFGFIRELLVSHFGIPDQAFRFDGDPVGDLNRLMVIGGAAIALVAVVAAFWYLPVVCGFFVGVVALSYGLGRMREQGGQASV